MVVRPNSWFSRSVLWISEVFITLTVSSSSRLRTSWNHDIFCKGGVAWQPRKQKWTSQKISSRVGKQFASLLSGWQGDGRRLSVALKQGGFLHFSKSDAESSWSRCGFCFYISQGMCERALIPETLSSEMLWLNRPWRGATTASLLMLSTSPTSPFSKDSY